MEDTPTPNGQDPVLRQPAPLKRTTTISFDKNQPVPTSKMNSITTSRQNSALGSSTPAEKIRNNINNISKEDTPAEMAMSSLRCPSPPPILNHTDGPPSHTHTPPAAASSSGAAHIPAPQLPTPGGRVAAQAVVSAVAAQRARDRQDSDFGRNSMHPHFFVEEKPNRSRSASNASEQPVTKMTSPDPVINTNLDPRLPQDDGKFHVLFAACGSISVKKTRLIINKLEEIYKDKVSVQLILTSSAEHFVSRGEFPTNVQIWRDKDEWDTWGSRTDPVLHIELRRWADVLVIAPCTANTLAKIALGLCDNLVTNVVRAWNTQYPILIAPAMVSYAYNSPTTKRHLKTVKEEMTWIEVLKPTEKVVGSYGGIGMGGMMDWNEIVDKVATKAGGYPDEEDDEEEEEEEPTRNEEEDEIESGDDSGDESDDDGGDLAAGVRKITVAEEDQIR